MSERMRAHGKDYLVQSQVHSSIPHDLLHPKADPSS